VPDSTKRQGDDLFIVDNEAIRLMKEIDEATRRGSKKSLRLLSSAD